MMMMMIIIIIIITESRWFVEDKILFPRRHSTSAYPGGNLITILDNGLSCDTV